MRAADVVDGALEFPVVTSFSRVGYAVRRRVDHWGPPAGDLSGRVVLVTGATSGLGRSIAGTLAAAGAEVVVTGRDATRTGLARDEIAASSGGTVHALALDMADLDAVRDAAADLPDRHPGLDTIVHNAGALSAERTENASGIEMTIAAHVVGPFLMTSLLVDRLGVASPGRVITMSSGGMYTAPLSVDGLEMDAESYNGTTQYALAKRAQVTLNELWAERVDRADVVFHALHPGWADTPGVAESLPTFGRVMGPLLRTPGEGADTAVWLVADGEPTTDSGRFWHDRRVRPIHRLARTRRSDTADRRRRLWDRCAELAGLPVS